MHAPLHLLKVLYFKTVYSLKEDWTLYGSEDITLYKLICFRTCFLFVLVVTLNKKSVSLGKTTD